MMKKSENSTLMLLNQLLNRIVYTTQLGAVVCIIIVLLSLSITYQVLWHTTATGWIKSGLSGS
jgi:hypothetical protein